MTTFDTSKHVAFDVETSSEVSQIYALQPFRAMNGDAFLTSFAWARFRTDNRFDLGGAEMPEQATIKSTLDDWIEQDLTVVGWNTAFDAAWLIALGFRDEVMRLRWLDGMLLWQHLEREPEYDTDRGKRRSYGLKQAVAEYMPRYAGYDEGVDFHDLSPAACAKRFKYNKLDAKFTLALTRKFFNRLAKQSPQQLRNAMIEASAIPLVADSMVNGLCINQDNANTLSKALQEVIDEKGSMFGAYAGLQSIEECDKILASPAKLRDLLYTDWALPVQGRTAKGAPSTDKVALHALAAIDDRVKVVKDYREAKNNRTKFVENVLKSVEYNGDGKSRPGARIYGTYTGRVTFASKQGKGKEEVPTGFAIHQMKRAPEFRDLIEAPEGFVICEWDAAGQEYRWMAIESGDETMLSLCMPGEDPHGYMGAQIAHRDYRELLAAVADGDKNAKNNRQLGKVGNLSCQYRISAAKLLQTANVGYDMGLSMQDAEHIHRTYYATYPGVKQYWQRQINKCRRKGYAETIAGRRVQLKGSWTAKNTKWKQESTAVNFPIQGIGADQKYLAMRIVKDYLTQFGGRFYFELHDGLYAILPEANATQQALKIQQALNNLPYKKAWGFTPPIPLPWDLKIGKTWGSMKEIK